MHGYQTSVVAPPVGAGGGLHVGQGHYSLPNAFGHEVYPNATQAIAQYCESYLGYH